MKKVIICFLILTCLLFWSGQAKIVFADCSLNSNVENEISSNVNNILDSLNTDDLDSILSSLGEEQDKIFDGDSFANKVKKLINGEFDLSFSGILSFVFGIFVGGLSGIVPLLCLIGVIAVVSNLIMNSKSSSSSKSVGEIIHLACFSIIVMLILKATNELIGMSVSAVNSIKTQMEIIFPILLTLMASVGSAVSVGVFQPLVAILSGGIIFIFESVILPLFIFSLVFNIVGNLSSNIKLDKFCNVFNSAFKTIIGFVFTLFAGFLTIQGITAGSYDGISFKTAKFALKSYIPFLGGYISDGLNLIVTSSVLVKNAVGVGGLLLLFSTILKPILTIVCLKLGLDIFSGVLQPITDKRVVSFTSGVSKSLNMLMATLIGISFAYLLTVGLIMCCSNLIF